jgi:hypothetical protein
MTVTTGAGQHLLGLVGRVETFFDVGFGDASDRVAHFFGYELRGVRIDDVVDLQHLALLHQQANDVYRAFRHAVGEIADRDRFGDRDFTHELFLRLVGSVPLEALGAAAERGDRALAHFIGAQRSDQRQTAAFFRRRGARRSGTGGGWTCGTGSTGTARDTRSIVFFRFELQATERRLLDLFLGHKTLLGDFASLALGFFLGLVTRFLLALARIGGFAFGLLNSFARGAAARFFLGNLAFFGFAHARVGKRVGARDTFFLGQRAQHDAGFRRFRGWRGFGGDGRYGLWRFDWLGRGRGLGFSLTTDSAALLDLDHDLLAAAMAEALAHNPGLRL